MRNQEQTEQRAPAMYTACARSSVTGECLFLLGRSSVSAVYECRPISRSLHALHSRSAECRALASPRPFCPLAAAFAAGHSLGRACSFFLRGSNWRSCNRFRRQSIGKCFFAFLTLHDLRQLCHTTGGLEMPRLGYEHLTQSFDVRCSTLLATYGQTAGR